MSTVTKLARRPGLLVCWSGDPSDCILTLSPMYLLLSPKTTTLEVCQLRPTSKMTLPLN